MQYKDVTPIIAELVRLKNSIPLEIDVGRYLPEVRKNTHGEAVRSGLKKALRVIEQAPVVDAVPVVHARWVHEQRYGDSGGWVWRCSACRREAISPIISALKYCHSCGAKMDAKEDDNA